MLIKYLLDLWHYCSGAPKKMEIAENLVDPLQTTNRELSRKDVPNGFRLRRGQLNCKDIRHIIQMRQAGMRLTTPAVT